MRFAIDLPALLLIVIPCAAAQTAAISIDFVGRGTAMGAAETAGVTPTANWNNATGTASTTPLALVDETGAATGATVSWSAEVGWSLPIIDTPGNSRMMYGYLDTLGNTPTVVTVSGLPASAGGYTVYVYADGDNISSTRTGSYQIAGAGTVNVTDVGYANFAGSFAPGNCAVFTVSGTSFTLTATGFSSSDQWLRAPVNGIQIVPAGPAAPDFSLSVSPSSRSANPGGSTAYTVNVASSGGFSGAVALSASGLSPGVTAAFSPTSVTGSGTSTMTVTAGANTPLGTSTLTVAGSSGALSHNSGASFTVVAIPSTQARAIGINFPGRGNSMGASETAGLVPKANWNNAAGGSSASPLALLDETGSPTGATVTWTSQVGWNLPTADAPGNSRMMGGYIDTLGTAPTQVAVAGLPVSGSGWDIYVYADGDNQGSTRAGAYQISGPGIAPTGATVTDLGSTNFSGTFVQSGNYAKFTITASGFTLSATPASSSDSYLRAPINGIQIVPSGSAPVADFSLSAAAGSGASFTVTVAPLGGFSGAVSLSVTGLPTGANAAFVPPSITASGSSTLAVTPAPGTAAGSYPLTVTGASGNLSHTANVTLAVSDFSLSISPSSRSVTPGGAASYAVTMAPLGGFTGTVSLAATGLPAGAGASFSPPSIATGGSSALTVTTTAGTPVGGATLFVTGSSGGRNHTVQATLQVNAVPVSAPAAVGINFTGRSTPMAAAEMAGAVPKINWNNATGASSAAPLPLNDEFGNPTAATATWSSDIGWSLPIATPDGNSHMMSGYLDTLGTPTTITVAGLPASASGYNVYVYTDGDNGTSTRTGRYQIGASAVNVTDSGGANFSGAWEPSSGGAGNYTLFNVAGAGFTLTATAVSSSDPWLRAPVNGIQIVPAGPPDFALSASPATGPVAPGGSVPFTVGFAPLNGFSTTVNLSLSGLPSGATAAFNPPTLSSPGNSTLTVTTAPGTATANFPLTITATGGNVSHTAGVTLAVAPSAGALSATLSTPATTQNLTALGVLDWAHWGYQSNTDFNHKAGIAGQIGNASVYNGEAGLMGQYGNNPIGFSWSDGTPNPSAVATTNGIRVMGLGKGLQFVVPASTTTRTLTVYLGVWNTQGKIVAHLSDGSAPDYVDTSVFSTTLVNAAYTFTYRAASQNQQLVITYTQNTNATPRCAEAFGTHCFVTLQGATLQ